MAKNHGINLYEESWEQLTRDKAFEGFMAEEVCISLCQMDDIICKPTVEVGDFVSKGQVIGEPEEDGYAYVHASVSGYVKDIFYYQRAPGLQEPFVKIKKSPTKNREWYPFALDFDKSAIQNMMYQIGIHGKHFLSVRVLIVNGFANEPYITSGYRLLMESPGKIVIGAVLGAMAADAECIYLCINEDAFDAVARLKRAVQKYGQNMGNQRPIWILPMKRRYPGGNEYVIRKIIMGKEKGNAKVVTLAEMAALYDGIYDGEPWTKVGVTISGKVANPKNLWVPIGTSVKSLIDYCGGMSEDSVVIYGGPLGGKTIDENHHWVQRNDSGFLVLRLEDIPEFPCIHCGMCRDVCPQQLKPDLIEKNYLAGEALKENLNPEKCIRCGLCSYICPSGRRLTEYVGQVKKGRMRTNDSGHQKKGSYIELSGKRNMFGHLKRLEEKTQSPPHIHRRGTIRDVMRNSIYSLIPLVFGLIYKEPADIIRVLSVMAVGGICAGLTEYFWQEIYGQYVTVRDGSAVFTGFLLALLFSENIPLWKVAFASITAILLGKQCFGGIGHSPIHPVILGKLLFDPFGTAMIDPLWYAAILSLGWMIFNRMIPWTYSLIYLVLTGLALPALLTSAVLYVAAAFFIWSYETMAPSKNGRWIFTVSAALLTIGFYRIGMGVFGITFAIAFSDLLIPLMTLRFVKRI